MEDFLVSAFLKILNMSMTASYIIIAVIIARFLLGKAPKKYSYALWAVAAFRLVCPVSFKSVISIFSLKPFNVSVEELSAGTQAGQIVHIPKNFEYMAQPEIQTGITALDPVVNGSLPAATPMASVNPIQIWEFIGALLWVAGMVILLIISLAGFLKLCRKIKTATVLEGNVRQSEYVQSPFIIGFLAPKIYIPYGLEEQAMGHVLAHERAHIRRRDHIIRILAWLVLCLHWFNPLVWLAFYLMGRDMELSCDEKVLAKMRDRAGYSATLLSFATRRRFPAPTPLAFGESSVGRRIKNALKWKRPRLWVSAIAFVLCVAVIAACAANPKEKEVESWEFAGRWVPVECVYNSPVYSSVPLNGDNGYIYEIHGEGEGIRVYDRQSGEFLGGFGPIMEWEEFPYSDEDWSGMFMDYSMTFSAPISEIYDEILYIGPGLDLNGLPIQEGNEEEFWRKTSALMAVDGELWIVSTARDTNDKQWVSSIYALKKEDEFTKDIQNIDSSNANIDSENSNIPIASPWSFLIDLVDNSETTYKLVGGGFDHSDMAKAQINSILEALASLSPDEVKVGRGMPYTGRVAFQIPSGDLITLGYCGNFVELQLSDNLKELYPAERGVWEIHNASLTALLAELTAVDGDYSILRGKAEDAVGMELILPERNIVLGEVIVTLALEVFSRGESSAEVYVVDREAMANVNYALKVNYIDGSSELLFIDIRDDSFNRYTQSEKSGNSIRVTVACPELWALLKEQAGIVERDDLLVLSIGFQLSGDIAGESLEVKLGAGEAPNYSISASVELDAAEDAGEIYEYGLNFSKESFGEAMEYDSFRVGFFLDGKELYSGVYNADDILYGYMSCQLRSDGVFTVHSRGPNSISFEYDPDSNSSLALDFGQWDFLELTYDGGHMFFSSDAEAWGDFTGSRAFFEREHIRWSPMEPTDDGAVLAELCKEALIIFAISKDGVTYGGSLSIVEEKGIYNLISMSEQINLGVSSNGAVSVLWD